MKSRLKKLLPAIIMAIAVAGAFSTHAMDQKAAWADLEKGYIQLDPEGMSCAQSSTDCTNDITGVQCRVNHSSSGTPLFSVDASGSCAVPLYQPLNN